MSRYRKGILAVFGAAAAIIGRHYGLTSELYTDATLVVTAAGVILTPNDPPASSSSSSGPVQPI